MTRLGIIPLMVLLISLGNPLGATATETVKTEPPAVPNELIVLLARGAGVPTAEEVVDNHRRALALPAGLGEGDPTKVELALSHRARGNTRALIELDPDGPRARLERYLLLTYPESTDLDAVRQSLESNPSVVSVGKNYLLDFAVTPSDPLFPIFGAPADHQWGSHILNLPAAWDYAKGHSYVGLIDTGLQAGLPGVSQPHPDLRSFGLDNLTYEGGSFRPQFSWDFRSPSTCDLNIDNNNNDIWVDEREPGGSFGAFGHGTHVSGIVAASADNEIGVAGACWHCSLMMTRAVFDGDSTQVTSVKKAADALTWLVGHGAQAVSMSFGVSGLSCNPPTGPSDIGLFCDALDLADDRDVVVLASPGNDKADIEFPANDSRVLSIGGIEPGGGFWDRLDEGGCPCSWIPQPSLGCTSTSDTRECGSNYTVTPGSDMQDLVAPAKQVLSTFYEGQKWNEPLGCHDLTDTSGNNHAGIGYDLCTGTSMSSPYVAGLVGILRSVNPLYSKADIRDLLITNASRAGSWDPKLGYGIPDTAAAVEDALGRAGGMVLDNRLTPLFSMYSSIAQDHFYTTFPQWGAAAYWSSSGYVNVGPDVAGYGYFPTTQCVISPCLPEPGASVYVFSTDRSPNGHPLVPLYRMSFEGTFPGGPANPSNRETTFTTEAAGIDNFRLVGYDLDGIEGYIYQRCTPEPSCIPQGAVRLYRLYNFSRDDYAIFPESELATYQSQGYVSQPGLNAWIGYVYPNADSDGDHVIDGFEALAGTDPGDTDSDDDGASDGEEMLEYPLSDPLDNLGHCTTVFADSFDTGNTSNWGAANTAGAGTLKVTTEAAMVGPFGLAAGVEGGASDQAFVVDFTPSSETHYRASFHYDHSSTEMGATDTHLILVGVDDNPSGNVLRLEIRRSLVARKAREFRALARLDNGTWAATSWFQPASAEQVVIEVEWWSTPSLAAGGLKLSFDGVLQQQLTGLANAAAQIDRVRFGVVNGVDPGTRGESFFDEFISCRD